MRRAPAPDRAELGPPDSPRGDDVPLAGDGPQAVSESGPTAGDRSPTAADEPPVGDDPQAGVEPGPAAGDPSPTAGDDPPPVGRGPTRRPLYVRLLRLRHVDPASWQRALLAEGSVLAAIVLALADLTSAWVLLVLPVSVAAVVKSHDLAAGWLTVPPASRR